MTYGETLGGELTRAGLAGLPIAWGSDRIAGRDNLTPEQDAALQAVLDAHDPDASEMPDLTQAQWRYLLRVTQAGAILDAYLDAMPKGTFDQRGEWAEMARATVDAPFAKWSAIQPIIARFRDEGVPGTPTDEALGEAWLAASLK